MRIVAYKNIWLTLSALAVVASVAAYSMYGLHLSADFTEGTLISIQFGEETAVNTDLEADLNTETVPEGEESAINGDVVTQDELRDAILSFHPDGAEGTIKNADIKESEGETFIIRLKQLEDAQVEGLLAHITEQLGEYELLQSRNVSPTFAKTFRDRAIIALLVASAMIILYITFAFRRVSRGIKSWKLGVAAIIALIHDVVIIVGIFVLLGQYYQVEIDALFITALLSVMGFSVNDTIVVFDRVRENLLLKKHDESFSEVAERSLQQTLARSINTSFSTLLVLVSLLVFGAYEIFYFVLALALGVVVGTYSSIFLATPLLTIFQSKDR